ncbi:MAG: hypothetical protein U0174_02600 [Polyangiaceae bacterium]
MYRGGAELEHSFGVDAGRYSGGVRTIDLGRAPVDVRTRLADILTGHGRPRPLYAKRTSLSALWGVLPLVFVLALGGFGFGAKDSPTQAWTTLALYIPLCVAAAYAGVKRLLQKSGIPNGVYLLPLDLVHVSYDRATIHPLGDLRRVTRAKTSLMLEFRDGSTHELPFASRAEVREVYEELDRAHHELLRLTYSADPMSGIEEDPFHSFRVDDSWNAATASAPRTGWLHGAAAVVVGVVAGVTFLAARNHESAQRAEQSVKWSAPNDPFAASPSSTFLGEKHAPLPEVDVVNLRRIASLPDSELTAAEAAHVNGLILAGMRRYEPARPKSGEVPAYISMLLDRGRMTGHRALTVSFSAEDKSTLAWSNRAENGLFFDGTIRALRHAFGEYFSPVVLSIERAQGEPDLLVRYAVTAPSSAVDSEPDRRKTSFVFHVTLGAGFGPAKAAVRTFDLTMLPSAEMPPLRVNSIFPTVNAEPEKRLAARAFDRLFDELHETFFAGPIHVPIPNAPESF